MYIGEGTKESPYLVRDWQEFIELIAIPDAYVTMHVTALVKRSMNVNEYIWDPYETPLEFRCKEFDGQGIIINAYANHCIDIPYCIKIGGTVKNVVFDNIACRNAFYTPNAEGQDVQCMITGDENASIENVIINGIYEGIAYNNSKTVYQSVFCNYLGRISRLSMDLTPYTTELCFTKWSKDIQAYSRKERLWEYIHAKLDYHSARPFEYKSDPDYYMHWFQASGRKSLFEIKKPIWFTEPGVKSLISLVGYSDSSIITFGHNDITDNKPFYYITTADDINKYGMATEVTLDDLRNPDILRSMRFAIKRSSGEV